MTTVGGLVLMSESVKWFKMITLWLQVGDGGYSRTTTPHVGIIFETLWRDRRTFASRYSNGRATALLKTEKLYRSASVWSHRVGTRSETKKKKKRVRKKSIKNYSRILVWPLAKVSAANSRRRRDTNDYEDGDDDDDDDHDGDDDDIIVIIIYYIMCAHQWR